MGAQVQYICVTYWVTQKGFLEKEALSLSQLSVLKVTQPQFWEGTVLRLHLALTPLSPKNDQHQISPCNINALYKDKVVMSITDMITQDEFAWCFINFSPLLL